MQLNIAPCGLICSRCDAYRATQENNREKLERVAAEWRKLNHCDEITAGLLLCDGCMTDGGRKSAYCGMCKIRLCAIQKDVKVCSECSDYPCATVSDFLAHQPEKQAAAMRKMLDGIAEVEKNTHSVL